MVKLLRTWNKNFSRRRKSSSVEVVVKTRRDENLIPPSQLRQRTHPTSPGKQKTEVATPAAEPAAARRSLQQPAAAAVVQSICARKQTTRVDHRVRRRRRNIGAACEGASWCGAQRPATRRARAPYLPCRRHVHGMRTIAQGAIFSALAAWCSNAWFETFTCTSKSTNQQHTDTKDHVLNLYMHLTDTTNLF